MHTIKPDCTVLILIIILIILDASARRYVLLQLYVITHLYPISSSQELLFPNGSNGKKAATKAITPYNAAQTYIGTAVLVFETVEITALRIPITLLQATDTPLPVAL